MTPTELIFYLQVLSSLFYAYYVFVRLCIPQFRSISLQLMDLRATVLCVFNSILPGEMDYYWHVSETCLYTSHLTQSVSVIVV